MKKKEILLTGATGFLGSHLLKKLIEEGYKVTILKRTTSNTKRIENLSNNFSSINYDETTPKKLFSNLTTKQTIIHTATDYSNDPIKTEEANILFPLALLKEAIDQNKIDSFINAGTSLPPTLSPYASSKQHFLQEGKQLTTKNKIPFVNLLLEHFFGIGENPKRFPSYIITNCLDNNQQIPLTKGEQKRDFIYIDDVVKAFSIILNKQAGLTALYEEFSIGSGKAITIKTFVNKIKKLTQSKATFNFNALPYRKEEVMLSQADTTKIEKLGWSCQHPLDRALKKTINHFCQEALQ